MIETENPTPQTQKVQKIACGVCLSGGRVSLLDSKLKLYKCGSCSHTMTVDPHQDPNLYSAEYYSIVHKNWFTHPNYRLFEFIRKYAAEKIGPSCRLLDVGCGNGDFLKYLASEMPKAELYGIDTMKIEHERVHFLQGDFFDFKNDRPFDAITNLTVIEHIEPAQLFVKKIGEHLTADGLVFTTTNNNDCLLYKIARALNRIGIHSAYDRIYSSHHVHHFTNASLKRLFEMNGYDVVFAKNHNYPLQAVDVPPANAVLRGLYRMTVAVIFFVSSFTNSGFLQTLVCKKCPAA